MNKFRFNINSEDRFINIPIQINTDLLGKDDLVEKYEDDVLEKIINPIEDFEVTRYNHNKWFNSKNEEKYSIEYKFNFFDRSTDIESTNPNNSDLWVNDYNFTNNPLYQNTDFTEGEIYYNVNSFKGSFFKLDFYDTTESETQRIFLTIVLPTEQGRTRETIIPPTPTPTPSVSQNTLSLCNEYSVTNQTSSNFNFTYLGCDGSNGMIVIGPGDTETLCFTTYNISQNSSVSVNNLGNCINPLFNHNNGAYKAVFEDCFGNVANLFMSVEAYWDWYFDNQQNNYNINLFGSCYNLEYVTTETIYEGPFPSGFYIEEESDLNNGECDCSTPAITPTPSVSSEGPTLPCNEYSLYNSSNNILQFTYLDCNSNSQSILLNPEQTQLVCFTATIGPPNPDLQFTLVGSCETPTPSTSLPPINSQTPLPSVTPTITPTPSLSYFPPGSGGTVNPNPPGIGTPNNPSTLNAPEGSQIKIPNMYLDYIGDKQGYFLYWLKNPDKIKPETLYMSAKFFNGKTGEFIRMTNLPQSAIPNKFNFDKSQYFYYRVNLDYEKYTYEVYDINSGLRAGTENPINWYEYVNPE